MREHHTVIDRARRRVAQTLQNGFVRATGVLVGGTVIANLVTAAAMPVLTRLYTPEDMGILAVFASMLAILYISICLRFDLALSIAERDDEAVNLLALGGISAVLLSALLALAMLAVPDRAWETLGSRAFAAYAWILPPTVMVAGFYSLLQFWFVRRRAFGPIARSRISQSGASVAAQISLGAAGTGPIGLVVGTVLNSGAGALLLGARFLRHDRALWRHVSRARLRAAFGANVNYPRYSALDGVVVAVAVQLPVILVAAMAGHGEAGQLMLALFVIQAPMSLLGNALGQVFLSEAPTRHRDGTLAPLLQNILVALAKTGVGPLIALGFVAPFAFGFVFGWEWERAGVLIAWMAPWFALQLLTTPVGYVMQVTGHQRMALGLQVFGLTLRVGTVALVGATAPVYMSEAFAVSSALFYLVYLSAVVHSGDIQLRSLIGQFSGAVPLLAAWTAVGIVSAVLASALTEAIFAAG
ncbi:MULTISPECIES: lipopolysaccharide biosynthesis protein [unclassified Sphingomonas]|uniref:lipopolysaccharide biosynthesis protein n=1 Tax=unclassified Sphingomonas TaxID=196159 RepID=UPI00215183F7|nr:MULTISPECIES: oligosaccharide flippase family protein [unclassified Sphingomonas]MCR5871120.1 oligosaccharide flippase family protein [Sphingomonas sp. J344]UUY00565.1 oligosaccharide flippase family protein [Sphingomonas sp. J315]